MSPETAVIVLLGVLTVASYSLVGLLAIWAGLGRPHWFLRVAILGGTLLLLLLIPAYEPLLLFSIRSAVVILPLMLLKAVGRRSQHDAAQVGKTTADSCTGILTQGPISCSASRRRGRGSSRRCGSVVVATLSLVVASQCQ